MPKKTLYAGKYLSLIGEDGWEYVRRNNCTGIVVILALTEDRKVLFVEQFRKAVGGNVIEFPAGLVNDLDLEEEESMEEAATRELFEETGYRAKGLREIMTGPVSAGMSCNFITFYWARGIQKEGKGGGDATENITVHEVPVSRVDPWIKKMKARGRIVDPKTYAGLYLIERLRRGRW